MSSAIHGEGLGGSGAMTPGSPSEPLNPLGDFGGPEQRRTDRCLVGHRFLVREIEGSASARTVGLQTVLGQGRDLPGQRHRSVHGLARLDHPVDQPDRQGLLRADRSTGKDQVQRPALSDETGKPYRAAVDKGHSPPSTEHPKGGIAGRHPETDPGHHELKLSVQGLAAGAYILKAGSLTRKFMVAE